MCNIIQSFYSKKCDDFNMFLQSCYFALSSIYADKCDMPIKLYTDYDFKNVLEKAPYKNIEVLFEDCKQYDNIDPLVWAWPKFLALDYVPRDHVHIDGDVFLKDKSCANLLKYDGNDAIVQHIELKKHGEHYANSWEQTFKSIEHFNFPDYIDAKIPDLMPNNGVVGINSENLWNKYRDSYWYMVNQAVPGSVKADGWTAPDIIFEQYFLTQICAKDNYSIKTVLHGNTFEEINDDARKKRYQHVCINKASHLQLCINTIKKYDKVCYEALKSTWSSKFSEYFE